MASAAAPDDAASISARNGAGDAGSPFAIDRHASFVAAASRATLARTSVSARTVAIRSSRSSASSAGTGVPAVPQPAIVAAAPPSASAATPRAAANSRVIDV